MATSLLAPVAIDYPSGDGQPVAETGRHVRALLHALQVLQDYFGARRDDVYVAGNQFLYYREGDPQTKVAPDIFVVIGAPNYDRDTYRLWDEPKGPDFVLEITSRTTRNEDQGRKRDLYCSLAVTEYWQYDPTSDYLEPQLQGLRLSAGEYRRLPDRKLADGTLALTSAVLGLELRATRGGLRFHDPVTGEDLLTFTEMRERWERARPARNEAETRLMQEAAARRAAEARARKLEALLRERDADGTEP